MELEKLTRSQIVLLTLLTSFVSSIASAIVTVSLMEKAPPTIAQTVNRVVERTVEKVVPSQPAAVAAVTETIVVRDSDLAAKAIGAVAPSIVRLYTSGKDEAGKQIDVFVGMAVVVSASGTLIADENITDTGDLIAVRADQARVPVAVRSKVKETGISRLQATSGPLVWQPVRFASAAPHLGESIIAVAGTSAARVAQGIVTAVSETAENGSPTIETSIDSDAYVAGSPLINVNGEVVGLAAGNARKTPGGFLASQAIMLQNTDADSDSHVSSAPN